ncbi:MAG: hypothetical protein ACR2G2_04380 [Pseudonocardia sp.]
MTFALASVGLGVGLAVTGRASEQDHSNMGLAFRGRQLHSTAGQVFESEGQV